MPSATVQSEAEAGTVFTAFRAFSDPSRLRIMNLLQHAGETCVCDLVRVLDLPQAKVSRHLAYLRRAGLVDTRRDGAWVHYRLSEADGAVHRKMLECLSCCLGEVPELRFDVDRLAPDGCRPSIACTTPGPSTRPT